MPEIDVKQNIIKYLKVFVYDFSDDISEEILSPWEKVTGNIIHAE